MFVSFGVVFGVSVGVSLVFVVFFIVGNVSLCVTCLGIVGIRVSGAFCRCVPAGWWHAVRPVSACVRVCACRVHACVSCVRVRVCRVRMRGGQGGDDGCTAG